MENIISPNRIVVDRIKKSYGSKVLFSDLSFTVEPCEHIGISGVSGGGKTTLLKILMGLERQDTGNVINNNKASVVFQESRLFPWLCAKDNIKIAINNSDGVSEFADRLLTEFLLLKDAEKLPEELSGGMQRRISLARAIAYDKPLFLLDEPLVGLDKETKAHVIDLLKKYSKNKSMLIISHDREGLMTLTDKIIEL